MSKDPAHPEKWEPREIQDDPQGYRVAQQSAREREQERVEAIQSAFSTAAEAGKDTADERARRYWRPSVMREVCPWPIPERMTFLL